MVELDQLANNNGRIREHFIGFLGSENFNQIVLAMEKQDIKIAEIDYKNHYVIIDTTNEIDNHDAVEIEASRNQKYVRLSVTLNGNSTTAVSAHRIKNPDWWVFTEPPEDTYLLASCWVYAKDFYSDLDKFENTVQDVLENLNVELLHDYEAINPADKGVPT